MAKAKRLAPDSGTTAFPVRGMPGGWRDWWEDDDRTVIVVERERAARFDAAVQRVGAAWRAEIAAEAATAGRRGSARPGA